MNGAQAIVNTKIFIVDDDAAVRHSLADILAASFQVETFATPTALLQALDGHASVGCIIADVRMPEMTGLELLELLAQRGGNVPVVIITGHGDVPMAVRAIKAGATDFIEKPYTVDDIMGAVTAATAAPTEPGGPNDEVEAEYLQRLEHLTPRQRETLELIVQGHTNTSAAHCLGISPRTVEVHRAKIMEKMGAGSLAELVRRSVQARR